MGISAGYGPERLSLRSILRDFRPLIFKRQVLVENNYRKKILYVILLPYKVLSIMSSKLSLLPSLAVAVLLGAPSGTAQIRITEIMQSNVTEYFDSSFGDYPDSWVELHNAGTTQVDLSNYSIGIKKNAAKAYTLPQNTILQAGGYLLVMCDKEEKGLHTSFRLESDKPGQVILFCDGIGVDTVAHPAQPAPDIAYGLDPQSGEWGYELNATPGKANSGGICDATHILGEPVFSHSGCVSPSFSSVMVRLPEGAPSDAVIRFTTDGSLPTASSPVLKEGSAIDVSRTTTIRARVFAEGWLSPWATSHSYIRHHDRMTMPIVSLTTDKKYLDDPNTGILSGWNYEYDWRRPVNIEYFEAEGDDAILNQPGETRVGGGWSRSLPLKSLILYAHKRFGTPRFNHEFFPEQKPGITDFKSIMLRNAGNDFYETYMRDAVVQRVFGAYADLDWQAHRPAAVYINGVYKGILNIRERSNDNNIYTNYAGLEDIDMVENWEELKAGTMDSFNEMMAFMSKTGQTAAEIDSLFDSREYLDVHLMNLFFNNTDFPGNNMVHWRPAAPGGRWRIIVKDTDYAMGIANASSDSRAAATFNTLAWLYTPNYPNSNNWGNRSERTRIFRRMMACPELREPFFDRAFVYFGDVLNARRVIDEINRIKAEMETEWMYHYDLYGYYSPYGTWNSCIGQMCDWITERSEVFPKMFADYYQLGELGTLTVECEGDAVPLTINGITLQSLPFEGPYPVERTVRMEGTADTGREIEWEVTAEGTTSVQRSNTLELTMTDGLQVKVRSVECQTGIAAPTRPEDRVERIYDLQGRPVTSPERGGIYIIRRGNISEKRLIVK